MLHPAQVSPAQEGHGPGGEICSKHKFSFLGEKKSSKYSLLSLVLVSLSMNYSV